MHDLVVTLSAANLSNMNVLLLGVGIGLLSLIAPGPVNLTLIQVGARLGRRPALRGAVGIAGGDSLLGVVAVLILGVGAALPASVFSTTQVLAAGLLVAIGLTLAAKPEAVSTSIDRMQRPTRAFFLLTSFTPTALGGWIAMLAAMPFAADTGKLGIFTVGVLIASYFWHPVLGLLAAGLGSRLTDRGQRILSRCGGLSMGLLGLALASRHLV